ncbi:MAG: hypothetical protein ABI378_10770 [Chitinophagaceae bacterium]
MTSSSPKTLSILQYLIAVAVFVGLASVAFPYYRYFVDPDAVAYLTMAKRAAAGDTWRLVNALWSPLHPALVAVCIKTGLDALWAAQLTNALACLLVLNASFLLFRRFKIPSRTSFPLLLSLSVFLVYALYKQLFCDLWQVAFLLYYLLIISSKSFLQKPLWWLLCGFVMALATYSKVYSFYFLLLHFPLALLLLKRESPQLKFPWKTYGISFSFQILLLLPLVFLMHQKYGFWGLSKSGALNTSWTLVGHKTLKPEIKALIPPPYVNSPYTWEDPYRAEGVIHGRFESLTMMKSQVGHSIQAALQSIEAANQLSPFLLIIFGASFFLILFKKGQKLFSTRHKILLAAAAILPLGYLLLHFEARYIWLLVPLSMIFAGIWIEYLREHLHKKIGLQIVTFCLALSFIVYPAYDMKNLFRAGEGVYRLAETLTQYNIRGSFTSNDNPSRSGCVAYWLGCNYYTPSSERMNRADLLSDMRRYRVMFYFHHQNALDIATADLVDEAGQSFQRVDGNHIGGLQVFVVAP